MSIKPEGEILPVKKNRYVVEQHQYGMTVWGAIPIADYLALLEGWKKEDLPKKT